MAREHARLSTSVWSNEDFLHLTGAAQRLYLLIVSQPSITHAGVLPFQPRRWARLCVDGTGQQVKASIDELIGARFVCLDEDTEELLVRSFVRNDRVLEVPNVARAMVKAYRNILSQRLRALVIDELHRLLADFPDLRGWTVAEVIALLDEPTPEPLNEGFPEGLNEGFGEVATEPFANGRSAVTPLPIPLTPSPAPIPIHPGTDPAVPGRDDIERVCAHLAERIESNGSKRPRITKTWRDAARLLIDLDGHTEAQVMAAIDWCQTDEFWRSNILSMPTLRTKYDRLRLSAVRGSRNGRPTTDDRVATGLAVAAELAAEGAR